MDQEIVVLKLNINQFVGIIGVYCQMVVVRLKNVEFVSGSNSKLKFYLVIDILIELMIFIVLMNIDDMDLFDRFVYWKVENERLKFE